VTEIASRSKAWVCGRLLAGIAGLNSAGGMDVCLVNVVCCQAEVSATGRSLVQRSPTECDVSLSVSKCNSNPLYLQWVGRRCQTKKGRTSDAVGKKLVPLLLCSQFLISSATSCGISYNILNSLYNVIRKN
jgi:hypothetical protein